MGRIQLGMRFISPATKNIPNLQIQRGKNHSARKMNSHAHSGKPIVSVRVCVNPFRRKICASHKLSFSETKLLLRHRRLVQRASKQDATLYQRGIKTSSRKYTSSDVKRSLCVHWLSSQTLCRAYGDFFLSHQTPEEMSLPPETRDVSWLVVFGPCLSPPITNLSA